MRRQTDGVLFSSEAPYPMTPDGVPIVSNVESIRGLTLAVGMCGQGFMLGIGVGEEVASLALEDSADR